MTSKPSFAKIVETAKVIQDQLTTAQKNMQSKKYPIEHALFVAELGGDDLIHSLRFTDAAAGVSLTALSEALVTTINAVKTGIKAENKTHIAEITKNMFSGDFGDDSQ